MFCDTRILLPMNNMQPSSYIEFARKAKGKRWSDTTLASRFKRDVEKDDYRRAELPQILVYLQGNLSIFRPK